MPASESRSPTLILRCKLGTVSLILNMVSALFRPGNLGLPWVSDRIRNVRILATLEMSAHIYLCLENYQMVLMPVALPELTLADAANALNSGGQSPPGSGQCNRRMPSRDAWADREGGPGGGRGSFIAFSS
jgi:hypothetical protein